MSTLPGGLSGLLGGATAYAIGHTAGDIINRTAVYVGLAAVDDPYVSEDPSFILLRGLLTDVGQEIARLREWTHLQKEYTFLTVAGQEAYDLPADFRGMIDQTGWNRTSRFPLGGPLSPQEWQYLKGVGTGLTVTVLFRPVRQQMHLYAGATIPADYTIAYEYLSSYWVQPQGQSEATQAEPTASSDVVLFDPLLMTRALRVAFLKAKGFDSNAAQADYDRALELIKSEDSPSPVLSLNGGRGVRMLGPRNLPETGYGS
jgi:hypothetical protein